MRVLSLFDDWEDIVEGNYNYEGFFSIVLLVICDVYYIFNFINIGDYGSNNDRGVLENLDVGKVFVNNSLGVLDLVLVEDCDILILYFIVGDDIFVLKIWL